MTCKIRTLTSTHSQRTHTRATEAGIDLLATDTDLVQQSDYILSIVPPRDALATAQRIATALERSSRSSPLYFLDLNAISPAQARQIASLLGSSSSVKVIDGGILGGPPSSEDGESEWYRPKIPLSGPDDLASAPRAGKALAALLNTRHINPAIGAASGLKMCYAALHKGFTALAVQTFTTARQLGVLDDLTGALEETGSKAVGMLRSMPGMPPKAYRWVGEMKEIAATFREDGGFNEEEDVFGPIGEVYRAVAGDDVLGKEITEKRKRGRTVEDVAECMAEGLERRKKAQKTG